MNSYGIDKVKARSAEDKIPIVCFLLGAVILFAAPWAKETRTAAYALAGDKGCYEVTSGGPNSTPGVIRGK